VPPANSIAASRSADEILKDLTANPVVVAASSAAAVEPDLPEKLTQDEISNGFGKLDARIQACYTKFQKAGMVKVRVKIGPDGEVKSAESQGPLDGDSADCVVNAAQTAHFPKTKGAGMTVTYPFSLHD
jgi:hypothetical protein